MKGSKAGQTASPQVPGAKKDVVMVRGDEFKAKFRSKREGKCSRLPVANPLLLVVWKFLIHDVKAYLPDEEHLTMIFMRDLVQGKRKHIKGDQVKVMAVPS